MTKPLAPTRFAQVLRKQLAEPIAVVGMACRFPGAPSVPAFLTLLREGREALEEVPKSRWDIDELYAPEPGTPGKMCTRRGGFVEVDEFAGEFFEISPREAEAMDPQHRVLLEVAREALEAAGIRPGPERRNAGVFVGLATWDFSALRSGLSPDAYSATGQAFSSAAGRISYAFNLSGPCVSVDTACSSSLVAVHAACASLRAGECDAAVAGGVNVILDPATTIAFSRAGMMARDGRCKTFDERADGYVRGEGCGVVVLKRLSDAQKSGDRLLAVIRGSAVNHNGRSQGLTAPSAIAQQALIRHALAAAGLGPEDVDYLEAHGTGTSLGDPQEMDAIAGVFGRRPPRRPLHVGSVKTNIGHLEAAAGVAGLIKAVLALQHRELFPHLHLRSLNPEIDLSQRPLVIDTARVPWRAPAGRPRVAGVSSFGVSGTNAHVVVAQAAEATEREQVADVRAGQVVVMPLSARTDGELAAVAEAYADHLHTHPSADLHAVCAEAIERVAPLPHRLAVVASDRAELEERLRTGRRAVSDSKSAGSDGSANIGFLFTGEGFLAAGAGVDLYDTQPIFRRIIDAAASSTRAHSPAPSSEAPLGGGSGATETPASADARLFALQWALYEVWRAAGLTPRAIFGYGVGEIAAACAAGAMSFEDGLDLVVHRARFIERFSPEGGLLLVKAGEGRIRSAAGDEWAKLSVAGIDGPSNTLVSGDDASLRELSIALDAARVEWRRLNVSGQRYCRALDAAAAELERWAAHIQFRPPQRPLISTTSGEMWRSGQVPDAAYWAKQMCSPARFDRSLTKLLDVGCRAFVEIGPEPALSAIARSQSTSAVEWFASVGPRGDGARVMLESAAGLFALGADVRWDVFASGGRRTGLPGRPLPRSRVPRPTRSAAAERFEPHADEHPLLGRRISSPLPALQFEGRFRAGDFADHAVHGAVVAPATAYLEMAQAGARAALGSNELTIRDVELERAMVLPAQGRIAQLHCTPADGGARFEIFSREPNGESSAWLRHARGRIVAGGREGEPSLAPALADLRRSLTVRREAADIYAALEARGLRYGPTFRGLADVWIGAGEALARIELAGAPRAHRFALADPALLDACLHATAAPAWLDGEREAPRVPVSIGAVFAYRPVEGPLWVHARMQSEGDTTRADLLVLRADGAAALRIEDVRLRALPPGERADAATSPDNPEDILFEQICRAPDAERTAMIRRFIEREVSSIVGLGGAAIDASQLFFELGMSSLMAVELQYRVQKVFRFKLPATRGLDYESTESLVEFLLEKVAQ